MKKITFELALEVKLKALIYGIAIPNDLIYDIKSNTRHITLYSTTLNDRSSHTPEDLILETECKNRLCIRIRNEPHSSIQLVQKNKTLFLKIENQLTPVSFVESKITRKESFATQLGTDVLGIIPSNYCFYFDTKDECRFCELRGTFEKKMSPNKSIRNTRIIKEYLIETKHDSDLNYLALTSGNVRDYNFNTKYFIKIGEDIEHICAQRAFEQILITLIPPSDRKLLNLFKNSPFTKCYFPIELFNKKNFDAICPGKSKFGYHKILNALEDATEIFGHGNTYTNLVYGIQSKESVSCPYEPAKEMNIAINSSEELFSRGIIPAFTIYHYGGFNSIGPIELDFETTLQFIKTWGELALTSDLIKDENVLFGQTSLSNTLFNDSYQLAKQNKEKKK